MMRTASEKLAIIRLVEDSELSVRRGLPAQQVGILLKVGIERIEIFQVEFFH